MNKNKKFWNWITPPQNENGEQPQERVLELYGTIAESTWFDDDVTPKMFHDELFADSGPVTIWLSSPGGDCIAASQIYSYLMDYPNDVTVKIDGIAASAASVIAMAGTKVLMAPTSLMMIHDPLTLAYGNKGDMEKAIEMLDEVKESILNAYEIKTGLSRAKLSHLMNQETWMNANKAIELGFADDILEDRKKVAKNDISYSFSGKVAEVTLLDKLSVKWKPKEEAAGEVPQPEAIPKEEASTQPVEEKPTQPATVPAVAKAEPTPATTPATETAPDSATEAETDPQPEEQAEAEPVETGTPINELEKRLNLLK